MTVPAAYPSVSSLISVDDALKHLLAAVTPLGRSECVATECAHGRILACDLVSSVAVPPADNSAMDGYAVRMADLASAPTPVLRLSQRIAAGQTPTALEPGTAARIFTGGQIPPGADAVVMQENCEALSAAVDGESGNGCGAVRIKRIPTAGAAIRRRGEDVAVGRVVLSAGHRLNAAAIGMAATVGASMLEVAASPRVALFSTGDELVMPGEPLPPGAIYNSNRFMLAALLRGQGCHVTDFGNVPDHLDATRAMLREAAAEHDLIVSSGGVSVGEEDHLKPALAAEGQLEVWAVAIKPGKPLAFGWVGDHGQARAPAWFMGLPGNPVSSFVTFCLFVRPLLLRMQGARTLLPLGMPLRANFAWSKPDKRREFLRVRCSPDGGLDLYPHQGSGVLTSLAWADGLADIAPGQVIAPGDNVRFLPFTDIAS